MRGKKTVSITFHNPKIIRNAIILERSFQFQSFIKSDDGVLVAVHQERGGFANLHFLVVIPQPAAERKNSRNFRRESGISA